MPCGAVEEVDWMVTFGWWGTLLSERRIVEFENRNIFETEFIFYACVCKPKLEKLLSFICRYFSQEDNIKHRQNDFHAQINAK